jgi:hypothetical protein
MEAILGDDNFEVVLETGLDDEDLSQVPGKVMYEYVQGNINGVERSFTLFDSIYLNFCLENSRPEGFKLKSYKDKSVAVCTVNLKYLSKVPDKIRCVAWGWFFSALITTLVALALIYVGKYSHFTFRHELMFPGGIALATFAAIAFIVSFFRTRNKIIYKSYSGQIPIFEFIQMPRNESNKKFIAGLEKSINRAHQRKGVTMNFRLVGELKYLRKMSEAGVITQSAYEKARGEIFRHKEYRA